MLRAACSPVISPRFTRSYSGTMILASGRSRACSIIASMLFTSWPLASSTDEVLDEFGVDRDHTTIAPDVQVLRARGIARLLQRGEQVAPVDVDERVAEGEGVGLVGRQVLQAQLDAVV